MYSHRFQDFDSGKHKAGSSVKAKLAAYHRRFTDKSSIGLSMKAIFKYSSDLFFWQDENSTRTLISRRINLKRGKKIRAGAPCAFLRPTAGPPNEIQLIISFQISTVSFNATPSTSNRGFVVSGVYSSRAELI